jgi:hypothetical protein
MVYPRSRATLPVKVLVEMANLNNPADRACRIRLSANLAHAFTDLPLALLPQRPTPGRRGKWGRWSRSLLAPMQRLASPPLIAADELVGDEVARIRAPGS